MRSAHHLLVTSIGRLALIGLGLLAGLALLELGLRLVYPVPQVYYLRRPNTHEVFNLQPGFIYGMEGEAHFIVNSTGLRGPEYPVNRSVYTILAIGGSTTECLYLDQGRDWPALMGTLLAERTGQPVWVGNAGMAGRSSEHHVLAIKHLVPQYPGLDAVVVLVGGNDLLVRLSLDSDEYVIQDWVEQPSSTEALHSVFYDWPDEGESLIDHLRLAWFIGSLRRGIEAARTGVQQGHIGPEYDILRGWRRTASLRDRVPVLSGGLAAYEAYLVQMIELAEQYDVRLVFVTQPAVWRDDLPAEFEDLLWLGYVGVPGEAPYLSEFYTAGALAEGLSRYNRRLLGVCEQYEVECIDLAAQMNGDTRYFYDDLHFNYVGAQRVAEVLAEYFATHPDPR